MPGRPDHDIASFVAGAASLPATIRGAGHGAAFGAGGRLSLFRLATRAQVLRTARRAAKMPARRLVFSAALTAGSQQHIVIPSNMYSLISSLVGRVVGAVGDGCR